MSLEDKLYPFLALYERFPEGVKKGIGFTYRQLPESVRRGKRYGYFKELVEAGEKWDRKKIEEYQFEQVRRTLAQAGKFCPFYRRRFAEAGFKPERVQSLEDLRGAPMIEKVDVINHREEMAATNIAPSQRLYMTTGGSTGQPVGFYLEKGVGRAKEQAFLEADAGLDALDGFWGGFFGMAHLVYIYQNTEQIGGQAKAFQAGLTPPSALPPSAGAGSA